MIFRIKPLSLVICTLLGSISLAYAKEAEIPRYSQSNFGGIGLLQTPTARMAEYGQFSINYSDVEEYRYWSTSIQLFPWLEATVRYVDIRTQLYSQSPGFSGDQTLKDKGIDVKVRLLNESYWLPEVSAGFRDFGGTGLFESEFLAASKRVGPFDFHLGVGFGYLGSAGNLTNPFCKLSDAYCDRSGGLGTTGGKVNFSGFFKGEAAVFGGIEYQTPYAPLRLKLEYEGNDYSREKAGIIEQDSRFNVGLAYRYAPFDFQLSYQRGNTVGFSINYDVNFNTLKQVKFDPPKHEVAVQGLAPDDFSRNRLRERLYTQAGFIVTRFQLEEDELIIQGQQIAFRDDAEALERVGRILANYAPYTIKQYRIVSENGGLPLLETVINAAEFRSVARYEQYDTDFTSTYVRKAPDVDNVEWLLSTAPHGFDYGVRPFWSQMFGSPETFFMYQGGVIPFASLRLNRQVALNASLKATLIENFDQFNFKVDALDTPLPRVRTFSREYATRSKITLDRLYLDGRNSLGDNNFYQVYAGYLETMFAGVGAEFLHRKIDSNIAFGLDVNYVRQRDYNSETALFDYSVLTGFATLYWQPEILPKTSIALSAGRFLAKDVGVNIDVSKRFDSGMIVGAFAAFTDASAEDYGEGSFTKGFYLTIPFDLLSFTSSKGMGSIPWIPIARDGGQMLQRPVQLIDVTTDRRFYR